MSSRVGFANLAKNVFFTFAGTLLGIISAFSNAKDGAVEFLVRLGVPNKYAAEFAFFAAVGVLTYLLASLVILLAEEGVRTRNYRLDAAIAFCSDGSGERIDEFQRLRAKARKSAVVMGVGMTAFSMDTNRLIDMLKRKVNVRLLMIDPRIISREHGLPGSQVEKKSFEEYFQRSGYLDEIVLSLERLAEFQASTLGKNIFPGQVDIRVYATFVPINVTIVDEYERGGEMIFETVLPYSQDRMRVTLKRSEHEDVFAQILRSIENLWSHSRHPTS
jgi:hypothetical protein